MAGHLAALEEYGEATRRFGSGFAEDAEQKVGAPREEGADGLVTTRVPGGRLAS